jgi:hypothetical protein
MSAPAFLLSSKSARNVKRFQAIPMRGFSRQSDLALPKRPAEASAFPRGATVKKSEPESALRSLRWLCFVWLGGS